MSKPMIHPDKGQVISLNSIWSLYCANEISAECLSWCYLVGLNVFDEISNISDLILFEAARSDTDGYLDNFDDSNGLIEYLSKGVSDFRFWWAAHSRLDKPEGLYDACYLLEERVSSVSDFILDRVSSRYFNNIVDAL